MATPEMRAGKKFHRSSCRAAKRPKWEVRIIFIADHRVQGVDRLVARARAPLRWPREQEGATTPSEVFSRHRLHRCLGHPGFIQVLGVPSHDH